MTEINPKIEPQWGSVLREEFQKDYFRQLKSFLVTEIANGVTVYPPGPQIFAAFDACPFDQVKVVILGQDPYHGPEQAHGLSFSVNKSVRIPPSLKNIYQELHTDLGLPIPEHGDLHVWAEQGVLLLNATLSVRQKEPASHQGQGWETFTDQVIQTLSDQKENLVFLLWGNFARSKKDLIDTHKHHVLESPHPSPFSAHQGFFGCQHFSKTNEYLKNHGKSPIDWQV